MTVVTLKERKINNEWVLAKYARMSNNIVGNAKRQHKEKGKTECRLNQQKRQTKETDRGNFNC